MFIAKCKDIYGKWLEQQNPPVPLEEQLKFTDPWLDGWMKEYGVNLRKPNKRFTVSQEDRIERSLEYLQNVWRVRYFFNKNFNTEPEIYNGDQMPLHRNESSSQKTMSFTGQNTFVKENYMLSRERVTAFTQLVSEEPNHLPPGFVFKGKCIRTKLDPPPGVHFQWAEKGSYRVENMLETIKHLPNKANPFTCKNFDIYVLDNYSVHCTEDIKNALFAKGYVPIIMGGGITGDMQINDTRLHCPLKSVYRERESLLMIEQLRTDPKIIPSPNRNETIVMLNDAQKSVDIDVSKGFKSLFVTNKFDGSEDFMVSDAVLDLVGEAMVEFRERLLKTTPPKTIKELMKTITPPKVVKTDKPSKNVAPEDEGFEILDDDDNENTELDFDGEYSGEEDNRVDTTVEGDTPEGETVTVGLSKQKNNFTMSKLAERCHDTDILKDAKLLDAISSALEDNESSPRLTTFVIQIKANL